MQRGMHFAVSLILASFAFATDVDRTPDKGWTQWRGPNFNGVSPDSNPPTTWSENQNVKWKVPIPGHGLSTPIIHGDTIFLQSAIPAKPKGDSADAKPEDAAEQRRGPRGDRGNRAERGNRGDGERPGGAGQHRPRPRRRRQRPAPTDPYKFSVMALDRETGKQKWVRSLREEVPHEGSHRDGSLAPASPVTDGKYLYAYFGSRGLYCLDMNGEIVWQKDLGDMKTRNAFGEGASPVLHDGILVINWDHEGDSFIVALEAASGKEKWRQARDEPSSWSTPLVVTDTPKPQVIVSASNRVRGYDLATGETVWQCGGLGSNCAPTPVAFDGTVYVMSGHRRPAMLAIRYRDAKGDLTGTEAVHWQLSDDTSYVPSALLYDHTLYFLKKSSNVLSCFDAKTGKPHYQQQRLEKVSGVYASPIGAAGRVYITGRNGATYVLKHGPAFEVISINELDDEFTASPAIVGDEIYLRGMKHLYCLAGK